MSADEGPAGLAVGPTLTLAAVLPAPDGHAQVAEFRVGKVQIVAPWTRATPESSKVGGGFLTLVNTGSEPDHLVGGTTEVSGSLGIHEFTSSRSLP